MNNNRGNNRRRGRGNNRQQGGGQQLNRIDSRARGNAPQLLEKYRKLAHDAHLNGDRVQEEYYLQFADHYFRVLADQKQRQEESRQRRDDRFQDGGEQDRGDDNRYGDYDYDVDEPAPAPAAAPRPAEDAEGQSGEGTYEPVENPFLRESRAPRGDKPRKPRRPRAEDGGRDAAGDGDASGFDASVLPPAIGAAPSEGGESAEDAEAKPRRRTRRPRPSGDQDDALEAVN